MTGPRNWTQERDPGTGARNRTQEQDPGTGPRNWTQEQDPGTGTRNRAHGKGNEMGQEGATPRESASVRASSPRYNVSVHVWKDVSVPHRTWGQESDVTQQPTQGKGSYSAEGSFPLGLPG